MAISQIPLASTGLSTSDLITIPEWTQLASYTSTTAVSTISIGSLPTTYKKLKVMAFGLAAQGADNINLRLNSDSGSNYYYGRKKLEYTNAYSHQVAQSIQQNCFIINAAYTQNVLRYVELEIDNYSKVGEKKFFKSRVHYYNGGSSAHVEEEHWGYADISAAITSIQFSGQSYPSNNTKLDTTGCGIYIFGGK